MQAAAALASGATRRPPPAREAPEWTPAPPRDVLTAALGERDEAVTSRDKAERDRVTALNDRDERSPAAMRPSATPSAPAPSATTPSPSATAWPASSSA